MSGCRWSRVSSRKVSRGNYVWTVGILARLCSRIYFLTGCSLSPKLKTTWGIPDGCSRQDSSQKKGLDWNGQWRTEGRIDRALKTSFFQQFHCYFIIGYCGILFLWEETRHWCGLYQWQATCYFLILYRIHVKLQLFNKLWLLRLCFIHFIRNPEWISWII